MVKDRNILKKKLLGNTDQIQLKKNFVIFRDPSKRILGSSLNGLNYGPNFILKILGRKNRNIPPKLFSLILPV